jgi:hypothetical protein
MKLLISLMLTGVVAALLALPACYVAPVPPGSRTVVVKTPRRCPAGWQWSMLKNRCVRSCPPGWHWAPRWGRCIHN